LQQLPEAQHAIVSSLLERLAAIPGVVTVVLGGSHARGRALPGSDVDLGLLYAEAGRYELDYLQHPPFGFVSGTYLGEAAVAVPLHDPTSRFSALQRRVAVYPEALRAAIVHHHLAAAEFGLDAFARKFAARSDSYGTAACLTRAVNQLVMVLFAVNRRYFVNDKTALAEIAEMARAPRAFGPRVQATLRHLGVTSAELLEAVERITQLFRETVDLTDGMHVLRREG